MDNTASTEVARRRIEYEIDQRALRAAALIARRRTATATDVDNPGGYERSVRRSIIEADKPRLVALARQGHSAEEIADRFEAEPSNDPLAPFAPPAEPLGPEPTPAALYAAREAARQAKARRYAAEPPAANPAAHLAACRAALQRTEGEP